MIVITTLGDDKVCGFKPHPTMFPVTSTAHVRTRLPSAAGDWHSFNVTLMLIVASRRQFRGGM